MASLEWGLSSYWLSTVVAKNVSRVVKDFSISNCTLSDIAEIVCPEITRSYLNFPVYRIKNRDIPGIVCVSNGLVFKHFGGFESMIASNFQTNVFLVVFIFTGMGRVRVSVVVRSFQWKERKSKVPWKVPCIYHVKRAEHAQVKANCMIKDILKRYEKHTEKWLE